MESEGLCILLLRPRNAKAVEMMQAGCSISIIHHGCEDTAA